MRGERGGHQGEMSWPLQAAARLSAQVKSTTSGTYKAAQAAQRAITPWKGRAKAGTQAKGATNQV